MMTMHLLPQPDELPCFRHVVEARAHGQPYLVLCLTPRGTAVCACGRYKLCDPLVVACPEGCACSCHKMQGWLDER